MEKEIMENMENMEKLKKADFSYANDNMENLNYYTCDGHRVATFEQVMQYNEMYYQALKAKESQIEEDCQMRR